jgi:hypothetical protein
MVPALVALNAGRMLRQGAAMVSVLAETGRAATMLPSPASGAGALIA